MDRERQQPLEAAPAQADESETRGARPYQIPAGIVAHYETQLARPPARGDNSDYGADHFSDAARGAGSEIPHREEMEKTFGEDFSNVKSYPGQAAPMAALGARAATRADKVAFAGDSPDRQTVAHELTHVVQTRKAGRTGTLAASSRVSREGDDSEREADAIAPRAAAGQQVSVNAPPSADTHLLREEDEKTLRDKFATGRPVGAIDTIVSKLRSYIDPRAQRFVEQGDLEGMFKEIDQKLAQESKEDLQKLVGPIFAKYFVACEQAATAKQKEEKASAAADRPMSLSAFTGISPTPIRAMFKGRVVANGVKFYDKPTLQFGEKEQPAPLNEKLQGLTKDQVISVDDPDERLRKDIKGEWYRATAQVGSEHIDGYVRKQDVEAQPAPQLKLCDGAPLFGKAGPKPEDVRQQQIGDCFLIAAMAAVAATCPDEIKKRMHDEGSSVTVTLFDKGGTPEQPIFTPRSVSVDKSLWVDPKTGTPVYAAAGDSAPLWPAILEKAFVAFRARPAFGFIDIDKGGYPWQAFEVLLGRAGKSDSLSPSDAAEQQKKSAGHRATGETAAGAQVSPDPLMTFMHPSKMTRQELVTNVQIDHADAAKFLEICGTKKERIANDPAALTDLSFVEECASGLSPKGRTAVMDYCAPHLEQRLGSGLYSGDALERFQQIQRFLKSGTAVCLSTKSWGKGGTGLSGGENTTEVPGLASPHAYTVLATKGDPNKNELCYVKIRNPWGEFGRDYSKGFWGQGKMQGKEQNGGEFDLELSDLMRYFSSVSSA